MNEAASQGSERPIMVFDADCMLCAGAVRFILAHERAPELLFCPAQSPLGSELARGHGLDPSRLSETFLLVDAGRALERSDAAIAIARRLRRPWSWLRALRAVPRPIRDWCYDLIARRRYRVFGRRRDCFVPTPEQRARLIGQ